MKIDREETSIPKASDYGVLRVSETETTEIEAARAFVMINVASEKILFGNAAIAASEDLKSAVDKIKAVSEIKSAVRKAKRKADEMMAEIGYSIIGIRSCSDSYQTPNIGEIIIGRPDASRFDDTMEGARRRVGSAMMAVDFGAQLKSRKQISATCTVEFLVRETPAT
jgi:hypothetical protein